MLLACYACPSEETVPAYVAEADEVKKASPTGLVRPKDQAMLSARESRAEKALKIARLPIDDARLVPGCLHADAVLAWQQIPAELANIAGPLLTNVKPGKKNITVTTNSPACRYSLEIQLFHRAYLINSVQGVKWDRASKGTPLRSWASSDHDPAAAWQKVKAEIGFEICQCATCFAHGMKDQAKKRRMT